MLVSNPAFTESRNDKVRNFQVFLRLLKASELQHISSPRIMTRSGLPAMLFVGNETNGIEFECRPDVTNGLIDLASRIKIISTQAGATETNQLTNQFVSATGGGHVFSINAPGDASGSNIFVAAIGVEIVTNAVPSRSQIIGMLSDTNFQVVRHALEQRSGKESLAEPEVVTASGWSINRISMTNLSVPLAKSSSVPTNGSAPQLTYTGPGRQEIVRKLAMIRLDRVNFTATPLTEVMRVLCQEARERDPEHRGINFVINPVADQAATGKSLDPVTGLPLATNAPPATDMATLPIKVQLTNATLGDVLDAVVLVAPEPIRYSIQDYGVVFSARPPADAAPLFARTFKVDPNTFVTSLLRETRQQEVKIPSGIAPAFKEFCSKLGVDWESPKGKAVYFNDRRGQIYVKATEADLDTIERALATLNSTPPQLHIKARFYEVPKGTLQGMPSFPMSSNSVAGPLTGILTWSNAQVVMRALEARPGFENLAEPEVTTLSGRQTQMRATQVVTVITNFAFHDTYTNKDGLVDTNANISPQTCTVETGPVLDVVPSVLSDGHTINLALIPTMLEFLGYDQSTNTTAAYDQAGEKIDVPTVLPRFRTRQAVATVNLWDDQTAMLRLEPTTLKDLNKIAGIPTISPLLRLGQFWQSQDNEKTNPPKEILVFITATLVDAAGNRVHTDDELPFAQTGVPPQPSQPSPPGAK